ncbi:hypothetical protein CRENBAI_010623 [Crenichthys baileyi]|uniref:Uncharacterized protein n=1 Tax=Crenichthys baileyi TaxID=28760 RepID=A0AAV9S7K4_9TELE
MDLQKLAGEEAHADSPRGCDPDVSSNKKAAGSKHRTQPQRSIASVPIRTEEPEPHKKSQSSGGLALRVRQVGRSIRVGIPSGHQDWPPQGASGCGPPKGPYRAQNPRKEVEADGVSPTSPRGWGRSNPAPSSPGVPSSAAPAKPLDQPLPKGTPGENPAMRSGQGKPLKENGVAPKDGTAGGPQLNRGPPHETLQSHPNRGGRGARLDRFPPPPPDGAEFRRAGAGSPKPRKQQEGDGPGRGFRRGTPRGEASLPADLNLWWYPPSRAGLQPPSRIPGPFFVCGCSGWMPPGNRGLKLPLPPPFRAPGPGPKGWAYGEPPGGSGPGRRYLRARESPLEAVGCKKKVEGCPVTKKGFAQWGLRIWATGRPGCTTRGEKPTRFPFFLDEEIRPYPALCEHSFGLGLFSQAVCPHLHPCHLSPSPK